MTVFVQCLHVGLIHFTFIKTTSPCLLALLACRAPTCKFTLFFVGDEAVIPRITLRLSFTVTSDWMKFVSLHSTAAFRSLLKRSNFGKHCTLFALKVSLCQCIVLLSYGCGSVISVLLFNCIFILICEFLKYK